MKMIERIEIKHNLDLETPEKVSGFRPSSGNTYRYVSKIMFQALKQEEEYLIDNLYEIAKESGVGTLYIVNKDEFARYIKETLPKWLRRTKNEKW